MTGSIYEGLTVLLSHGVRLVPLKEVLQPMQVLPQRMRVTKRRNLMRRMICRMLLREKATAIPVGIVAAVQELVGRDHMHQGTIHTLLSLKEVC